MANEDLSALLEALSAALCERGWTVTTAESCTGGWVAKLCTDRAGSSNWFERGYVTYSNAAKMEMLAVDPGTLQRWGAVSEAVAREMAEGAMRSSGASLAVAVTGIAGPEGGTPDKPVGTVWFAWACDDRPTISVSKCFSGDREAVRWQSAVTALEGLLQATTA
ncbi:nicotinamide-nucleotide amidase [Wenzhouxiangellaceae bacterium CH-27]|uniref:Nicotinamide-nucleotide amidase n=1 Tax=Elongatibacter sediminis TaxID=3119006 RepID=A0AAW9RDV1_9GAMM